MPIKKRREMSLPLFEIEPVGQVLPAVPDDGVARLHYEHPHGQLWLGDSLQWLRTVSSESVDLVFADPPYNLKKADWDTFDSQEAYIAWSMQWIQEAARILRPTGSMYVCGFSEILADLKHPSSRYFAGCRWLIWNYRNKANLGKDWGRSHESILHLRKTDRFTLRTDDIRIPYGQHTLKYPARAQAVTSAFGRGQIREEQWLPNPLGAKPKDVIEIPTTCNGMGEKTPHPTQKPEELLRKLVLAASDEGQVVLDPFSGSGTTLVVAEQLKRGWLGCENNAEYNTWAIKRLETVRTLSIAEWLEYDRKNAERRASIR